VAPLGVAVESFGTLEQQGAPALLPAIRAARAFGIELRDHRARVLSQGAVRETDLVIGFEPFHVASAVDVGGAAPSRTFLLTELADAVIDLTPPTQGASVETVVTAADTRRKAEVGIPRLLSDPVGRPERRFLELYEEIDRLVGIVAARLFGADVQ